MANVKIYQAPQKIEISIGKLQQEFQKPDGKKMGKLWLLTGSEKIFRVALFLSAMQKGPVVLIDGANRFDGYFLVEVARRTGQDYRAMLRRFHISRTFTCYQTESTVVQRLGKFAASVGSGTVVILGLLDTYYDDQAPLREARQSLERVCRKLVELRDRGISVLLASLRPDVCPPGREKFFEKLRDIVEKTFLIESIESIQLLPKKDSL